MNFKNSREQILRYSESLSAEERDQINRQLARVNWDLLENASVCESAKGEFSPIPYLSVEEIRRNRSEFETAGKKAICENKVAAVLLAGGQGTRLGSSKPKGMFDIGVTHPLYIFELHIRKLQRLQRECGKTVPLFVMTSEQNHEETIRFFEVHDYFGYPAEFVRFFPQDMAPCVDFAGNLLLEGRAKLVFSPDGNGGWYHALKKSDILREFPCVEWFNVFGVDNVLARPSDPVFVGATILSGRGCGAKGVKKSCPEEKVGLLVLKDGLPTVIEYYEMDREKSACRAKNGDLLYCFGVTLNYLFSKKLVDRIEADRLPVHVVKKKVKFFDGQKLIEPETENAYKFETLILDMVRGVGSCLPFETLREEEFAPVKNSVGVDSVDTARELLKRNGISV